jgi:START domain
MDELRKQAFKDARFYVDSPLVEWRQTGEDDGVRVSEAEVEGSNIAMFRGSRVVERSADELYEKLWRDYCKQVVQQWDSAIADWQCRDIDWSARLVCQIQSFPFPVWDRVLLLLWQRRRTADGRFWHVWKGVDEHPWFPTDDSEHVQASLSIAATVFEPVDDGRRCRIIRIIHADPNGKLPRSLIHGVAKAKVSGHINRLADWQDE